MNSSSGSRRLAGAAIACVLGAAAPLASAAAPKPPKHAPAVQNVIDCRKLTADAERLACYDKTVDAMEQAEATGDLLTMDREQRRAVRRQAFGLALPSLTLFDRGEKADEADRLAATIASASQNPFGKWTFVLDDGAVWLQTDDNELPRRPHPGSTVLIHKGVLGSFFMNVDGQQALRVQRQR